MNRYKITYHRSVVSELVYHISSETLDEDGVKEKMNEVWKEHPGDMMGLALDHLGEDGEHPPFQYSGLTITNSRWNGSSLSEIELIKVVKNYRK